MSSGYRPPSSAPTGAWARHIHAVRRERGWSQTRGFEKARENGLPLGERSRSAYIAIDMGERQPTPAEVPALIATYGAPSEEPEQIETAAPEGTAVLVAMFSAFLDELREDRRVRQEQIAELIQEMRVDRLARQEWERGYLEATLELVEASKREADPPAEPLEAVSAQQARP